MRMLGTEEETLDRARLLVDAGASLLAVHGRTLAQKAQVRGRRPRFRLLPYALRPRISRHLSAASAAALHGRANRPACHKLVRSNSFPYQVLQLEDSEIPTRGVGSPMN